MHLVIAQLSAFSGACCAWHAGLCTLCLACSALHAALCMLRCACCQQTSQHASAAQNHQTCIAELHRCIGGWCIGGCKLRGSSKGLEGLIVCQVKHTNSHLLQGQRSLGQASPKETRPMPCKAWRTDACAAVSFGAGPTMVAPLKKPRAPTMIMTLGTRVHASTLDITDLRQQHAQKF